ncbi:hypothetical protein BH10ACT1_BH10ACT1_07890 [soil metagenome]
MEPRWADLFRWKHDENPFGPSPRWVAVEGDEVVGFRVFLRWEFTDGTGRIHRAVRAVDTATDPDRRGQGIFKRLTLASLDDLAADGVDFVFNTPNDQSRSGYLKMGWSVVGRPPVMALPTGPRGLARLRGARTAAELWSEPSAAGLPAPDALADPAAAWLIDHLAVPGRLSTNRTTSFLTWRYGLDELHYRALSLGTDAAEGLAIFRVRRRGTALEATVTELLVPAGPHADRCKRRLLRLVARRSGADYVLVGRDPALLAAPAVPAPGLGPILTWRALTEEAQPPLDSWPLTMGDLELF